MRNFKSPIFLVSMYILLNTGCKKTETQQFTPGFNVYMAGIVNHAAVVWKNGQSIQLAASSSATCIAVAGTDVYVGGLFNFMPGLLEKWAVKFTWSDFNIGTRSRLVWFGCLFCGGG